MLGFPDIVVWYVSLLTWPQRLQKHLHFLSFHFKNHLIKYPDKHNLILYIILILEFVTCLPTKICYIGQKKYRIKHIYLEKVGVLKERCQCRFSSWRDLTYTHLCPSQQKGHVHISENSGFLYVFRCNYSKFFYLGPVCPIRLYRISSQWSHAEFAVVRSISSIVISTSLPLFTYIMIENNSISH